MALAQHGPMVFIHSSDEMYGADRILLDIFSALDASERARAEFWFPTDGTHPERPLCVELEGQGATVRHVDLPVLRRAYRTPSRLVALALRLLRFGRLLRSSRPSVVYCTTSAMFLVGPVARVCGVPHVIGHVQELWAGSDRAILAVLGRAFQRLIVVSRSAAESIPQRLQRRVAVVRNATRAPSTCNPLTEHRGPLTYLVASRWTARKGYRTLLAAWETAGCPGRLVVLGGPPVTGEAVDVEELVRHLSDQGSVEIVGEVPDIGPYLLAADVMLLPSDRPESFGLVAAEAFAAGRPVIGSAGGGLLEIVTNDENGWLYPLGDVDGLASILKRIDRHMVEAAGARARTSYLERFTSERYAREWREAAGLRPRSGSAAVVPNSDEKPAVPTRPER